MLTQKIVVENNQGLHLRVASKIVEACQKYKTQVLLCKECKHADGCSIIDLLLLEAKQGTELKLIVNGGDAANEAKTMAAVAEVFSDGGGI